MPLPAPLKARLQRIANAGRYSRDGLREAARETAVRDLLILHTPLVILALCLDNALAVKLVLVFASFFSLIVELLNTAIEAAVDHTSTDIHPLAKRAKDIGSAAQMVALTLVALLWLTALCA